MFIGALYLFCTMLCMGDTTKIDNAHSLKQDSVAKSVTLRNIVIEGSRVTHYPDKDVWIITKDMRKNTIDTYGLLEKIPGIHYDVFREKLSYWGQEKIVITIDGKVKEEGYGGNLANLRFKKIEIYDHPDGRFAGYDAVVNLITYENWQGYDIRGLNTATILPSTNYGNTLSKRRHDYTYTYTHPRFDISSNINYNHSDDRYSQFMNIESNNIAYHSANGSAYTNLQKSTSYSMYADIDYKIAKSHTISAKYSFSDNDNNAESKNKIFKEDHSLSQIIDTERLTYSNSNFKDHVISAFYQGKIDKWTINSEVTHEVYSENSKYRYSEPAYFDTENYLDNKRKSWLISLDAVRDWNKRGTIGIGYLYYNKHYMSEEKFSGESFISRLIHNKCYITLSHNISKEFSFRIGGTAEHLNSTNGTYKDHQMIWGTNAMLRYNDIRSKFSSSITYKTSTRYPTLYQTMSISNQTDPLVTLIGNTKLKASTSHSLALSLRYKRIALNSAFSYTGNEILPIFITQETNIYKTYSNIKRIMHSSVLSYSPKSCMLFGNDLQFRASITYAGCHIDQLYKRNYLGYWGGQASFEYDLNKIVDIQIQFTKMTTKALSPQSINQKAGDAWELNIYKNFLKRHIQLQLSYMLPIKWGVESNNFTDITVPYYQSYISHESFNYIKNQIMLRLVIRLADGHVVRKKYHEQTQEKEVYNEIFY